MMDRDFLSRALPSAVVAAAFMFGILVLLALLLVWGFDLEASPAWQVGLHHLMLALVLCLTLSLALYPPLCYYGAWFRLLMLVSALAAPVMTFSVLWAVDGAYSGFRDPRIFEAVVISVALYVMFWALLVFPYSLYLLGRDVVRVLRNGPSTGCQTG